MPDREPFADLRVVCNWARDQFKLGVENRKTAIDGIGGEAPGIAVADSFRGPFRLLNKEPIFNTLNPYIALNGTVGTGVFRGEDFFLWQDSVCVHKPGYCWFFSPS